MTDHHSGPAHAESRSHISPLRSPSDGLLARTALIGGAERTLDLQYYLWDSDAVGYLLLSRLIAAADRGVRVRLLVDDMKLRSRTRSIASLCLHPNIDIRVFNPWSKRSSAAAQAFEFILRFGKLDHRMHNKLLVADNKRAIFGGRNIAAEHFGLREAFNFIDFDALLVGAEVSDLSDVFETFWESPASGAGAALDESVSEVDLEATRTLVAEELDKRMPALSSVLAEEAAWNDRERSLRGSLSPGAISVAHDAPTLSQGTRLTQVLEALREAMEGAERDLVVVTPFLGPSEIDVEWCQQIVDRGVRIRLLTNSLASNPGTISNSGFNRTRESVVKAGVELHELRTDAATKPEWETPPTVGRYLALHAKAYVIDRERVFLGSVNLDPRSKFLNTEMGVLIDSPALAEDTADAAARLMTTANSWRVDIGPNDHLRWHSDTETLGRQPARSRGQRLADRLFGLLPIRDYI